MDLNKTKIVRYTGDDWAALYVNGKLVVNGDPYVTDNYLATLLGVEEREGFTPFLGTERHIEEDLSKVEDYERQQEGLDEYSEELERQTEADELERQAEELRKRAAKLRR